MLSQSMCTCSNHLGLTCIASYRTPNHQVDPLETKLSNYSINYLNSSTKIAERGPVMEAININTDGTYFATDSEKAQAIPLYCLPDKKAIHGLPQQVEEKIREIEASKMSDRVKAEEKKKLMIMRTKAVAQFSEDIVSNKILKIAKEKGEECLVLTGYKTETYLCTVREKAKAKRSSPTDPLNEAEKDVGDLLGFDLDITQILSEIMAELPYKVLSLSDLKNNDGLKMVMKTTIFGKKMMTALETVLKNTSAPLSESTLKSICEYCSYLHQVEKASLEVDHLTIFPHQKKILQVETKSVINNPLSKLKEGASQCDKFFHLFSKCHGDILIPGYTFIKVVALPMIENQSKLVAKSGSNTQSPCANCKSYIWTQEELQKLDEWMECNIFTSPADPQTPPDYKDLFKRLVGFMSLSSLEGQFFHTEEEASTAFDEAIAGEDAGITAEGLSQEQQRQLTIEKLGTIKLKDTKGKPLSHIDTFILWNSDQLTLILQNPDRVCLSSYFGTGKSLLLKYMAKRKAVELMESGSSDKSVFVSLGAAKYTCYTNDWEMDTVYDIATRKEFSNTDVLFYSTKDVLNEVTTPQEREWNLKLYEIDIQLEDIEKSNDIEESAVEIASDLVNMVVTQYKINEVGDNDESIDSIQDQVNTITTLIERIEDGGDEDYGARSKDLFNETCTLLEMVRTLTLDIIMERLILDNPSFSYFFDEVSIVDRFINVPFKFPQLTNVWTVVTGSIWLALRPSTLTVEEQSGYDQDFTAFKSELEQNNVHFPRLAKCMRNTSNILQLAASAQGTEFTTSNSSSSLPFNTIPGPIPKLVICDDVNEVFTRGVSRAIELYSSSQPLVILGELSEDIEKISTSFPERDGSSCLVYNPDQSLPELEENVKMYLEQPKGIFITTGHLFNGCQAKHIITCSRGAYEIRSAILRARVTSHIVTYRGHEQIDELKKICEIVEI